ncbi:MAG: Dabb family protein [Burkholderiaceae bacterium]|nr:Dabb family protein [Microbacteriaceae bacterium]
MLRHIITWKLAADDVATRLEDSATISAALQGLVPLIPEIHSLTVSTNVVDLETNWDLVLVADYADEAALRTYIAHPEHQRVVGIIRPLVAQRAAVDFAV